MKNKVLFLTLKVFAATGGIEKVCRIAGKAIFEWAQMNGGIVKVFSMYDHQKDSFENKYFPAEIFRGFRMKKMRFIITSVLNAKKYDTIILSHINLLLVGWLIKKINPKAKLVLFAHGIEIWNDISGFRLMMLKKCDLIIPVSQFTSSKIQEVHQIDSNKCMVINNCLDPFLPMGKEFKNNFDLRDKYGFKKEDLILFTLTRLSSKERYKGYDKVLEALVDIKKLHPHVKYLIAGSYDKKEKDYIVEMALKYELSDSLVISGFIPDEELVAHFTMADIYVMPSMKEGFGIVFIEAMYYGLPVIAGNLDGSVDALCNGDLGILVDPTDTVAIKNALDKILKNKSEFIPDKKLLMEKFSYETYKRKLEQILN